MVQFTEETAREAIKIKDTEYTIATPFSEGHVCSDGEARALNQLLKENVRNNFSGRFKDGEAKPTQEDLDAYVGEYNMGVRSVVSKDPVEKEMILIIENKVVEKLRAAGKTKKTLGADKFKELVDAVLNNPEQSARVRAIATEIIAKRTIDF